MIKTIVIGLGNPILGDDGVGWKVAEEVQRLLLSPTESPTGALREEDGDEGEVTVDCFSLGGISLMERLVGYDRAILIDALGLDRPPGSIFIFPLEDLPNYSSVHTTSAHDTSLQNALKMGKNLSAHLPDHVMVVGIAARRLYDFSEELSPPLAAAVPEAARMVLELLNLHVITD